MLWMTNHDDRQTLHLVRGKTENVEGEVGGAAPGTSLTVLSRCSSPDLFF